ncbi:V(D)J recombination-activating protein 1-like [Amphiura filiformis]|uniref:V(D)J recombination-activating protein 1-like n=1 Tax=Amphiura filiformis TaxID=82378 RepID=UPI003B21D8AF
MADAQEEEAKNRHQECLKKLCRICSKSFQSKKKTTTYKVTETDKVTNIPWSELILRVYGYNTKQDSDDIHPTHFCLNCRRSMLGYCQRLEKSKREGTPLPKKLELSSWQEHTKTNCRVCSHFTKFGRKRKLSTTTQTLLIQTSQTSTTVAAKKSVPVFDHSSYLIKDTPVKVFAQAHSTSTKVGTETLVSRNVGLLLNQLATLKGPRKSPRVLKQKKDDREDQGKSTIFLRLEFYEDTFEDKDIKILSRYPKYICKNLNALPAIERELTCKVCDGILDEPVTLNPCEHSVCYCCIDMHLKSFGCICPVCSNFVSSITKPAKVLTRMISNLNVSCINATSGCEETMQLQKMWDHFIICKHHESDAHLVQ